MHGYIHIDLFSKTSAVKLRSIYESERYIYAIVLKAAYARLVKIFVPLSLFSLILGYLRHLHLLKIMYCFSAYV